MSVTSWNRLIKDWFGVKVVERKQRLESFQGLDRCLEADSSRENVVLDSCLSHDRSNQVVCENVSPNLFSDQFWSLASQFFHLHRRLDTTQIQFVVPALEIQFRKIFFGCLTWIKDGSNHNNGFRAKAPFLNFDSNLSDRK